MKVLSIIVPIYNVSRYVRKCVDSLLRQDLEDYEIILVDDGSTDGSGDIADGYSGRARVIHQINRGLSGARNTGIDAAEGEYVMFVDSDDYIEQDVLGGLMARIRKDSLDVLRFRHRYVTEDYREFNPYKSDPFQFDDYTGSVTDGGTFLDERMGTACYACAFIVRRELLGGCRFTPGIYFEDTDWTPRMLCKASRVAGADQIVYNYLVRPGSITHSVSLEKKRKVIEDKMLLIESLQTQMAGKRSTRWFEGMISATVMSVLSCIVADFYTEKEFYVRRLKTLGVFPISSYLVNARGRRKLLVINAGPLLYCRVLKLIQNVHTK